MKYIRCFWWGTHNIQGRGRYNVNEVLGSQGKKPMNYKFSEQCIVIYICKKKQQNAHFFINGFIQLYFLRNISDIQVSLIRKTVQAVLRYLSCIYIGRVVTVRTCFILSQVTKSSWQLLDFLYRCMIKYHKTACKSLPEDEHLVVRNVSKII
jgi:hypothetical protein